MKAHRIHTTGSQHTVPNTYCQFSVNAFWSHLTIQPPHFLLFLSLPGFPGSNAASYREHSLVIWLEWYICLLCSLSTWIFIKHKSCLLLHNLSLKGRQLTFMYSGIYKSLWHKPHNSLITCTLIFFIVWWLKKIR